jgi:hypothetical protein
MTACVVTTPFVHSLHLFVRGFAHGFISVFAST